MIEERCNTLEWGLFLTFLGLIGTTGHYHIGYIIFSIMGILGLLLIPIGYILLKINRKKESRFQELERGLRELEWKWVMSEKELAKLISGRIIRIRECMQWSQSELARRSKVTSAAISLIEKGNRIPSIAVLYRISNALRVCPSWFFGEENEDVVVKAQERALLRDFGDLVLLNESDKSLIKDLMRRLLDKRLEKLEEKGNG